MLAGWAPQDPQTRYSPEAHCDKYRITHIQPVKTHHKTDHPTDWSNTLPCEELKTLCENAYGSSSTARGGDGKL